MSILEGVGAAYLLGCDTPGCYFGFGVNTATSEDGARRVAMDFGWSSVIPSGAPVWLDYCAECTTNRHQ